MNAAAKNYDGVNKYIRITDIDEASSTYTDKDIVSPDGVLTDNYLVNNRDILLARTGASTGKSYLYKKSDGKLYYAGFLIRANVTTHDPYLYSLNYTPIDIGDGCLLCLHVLDNQV